MLIQKKITKKIEGDTKSVTGIVTNFTNFTNGKGGRVGSETDDEKQGMVKLGTEQVSAERKLMGMDQD